MYSLTDYGSMVEDKVRMSAYAQALQQAVKPESIVLDIGTGLGIFALLACQYGARHVYAVEPHDVIQVAHDIARSNGFAERITFIQDRSDHITLPQQADVIVSDLRGTLPIFEDHIPIIVDARARHLKPDGILIPRRDRIYGVLVNAPDLYATFERPWQFNQFGLDFSAARNLRVNSWHDGAVDEHQFLAEPQLFTDLDYNTITQSRFDKTLTWQVQRTDQAHGLALWFDAELAADITFSTRSDINRTIYGNPFLPFPQTVDVQAGDRVQVRLQAHLIDGTYTWRWQTTITTADDQPPLTFDQSTFLTTPLVSDEIKSVSYHRDSV